MKKKLLICGINSLLFSILKDCGIKNYDAISHKEIQNINFENYEVILLLSFDPKFYKERINITSSFEKNIADKIQLSGSHLIYISTSKLYENNKSKILNEDIIINDDQISIYAYNKKIIEEYFMINLNNNCTILRLSNILHSRKYGKNRKTFMATFYKNLSSGFINMPNNSFKKDFIDQETFKNVLMTIIFDYKSFLGIYNIGSGVCFKNDDFISAANSYGVSKLTYGGSTDSFQLDISKIKRKINIDLDINKLKNILYEYCK